MRVIIKIILSTVLLFVGIAIIGAIKAGMGTKVSTGGIGPFIIYPAISAGLYAIWKYNPDKKNNSSADNEILKKD